MTAVAAAPVTAIVNLPALGGGKRLVPECRYGRSESLAAVVLSYEAAMALAYLQTAPRPG